MSVVTRMPRTFLRLTNSQVSEFLILHYICPELNLQEAKKVYSMSFCEVNNFYLESKTPCNAAPKPNGPLVRYDHSTST